MKEKFKHLFIDIAKRVAECSYARRLKVGAVIEKDGRIISIGYNGTPPGQSNECEDVVEVEPLRISSLDPLGTAFQKEYEAKGWFPYRDPCGGGVYMHRLVTKESLIHAEMNAILKVAKSGDSCDGANLFLTHCPCVNCAKHIYTAGIKNVYFSDFYRDTTGIDHLKRLGVNVEKV